MPAQATSIRRSGRPITVGWREWLSLPDIGLTAIRAKVDTGARSSALHVDHLELLQRKGHHIVHFAIHPADDDGEVVECEAEVADRRVVTDSGGHRSWRYFIHTTLEMGGQRWPIEISLTDRASLTFPMLLGRTAMRPRLLVNPGRSFMLGGDAHHPGDALTP